MRRLRVRDGQCICATLHDGPCHAYRIVTTLARSYAMDVLLVLGDAPQGLRYGELQRLLDLPPNTLDRRLRELRGLEAVGVDASGGYHLAPEGARILAILRSLDARLGTLRRPALAPRKGD